MNRIIKYRAYWKDRMPQLGMCQVILIDWERNLAEINNGIVRVSPNLNEIILMQFTGLTDINGKEIYEGDYLLKYYKKPQDLEFKTNNKLFEVKYCQQHCGFTIEASLSRNNESATAQKNHYYKVIGNVYEK